jgi:hypothetical protein
VRLGQRQGLVVWHIEPGAAPHWLVKARSYATEQPHRGPAHKR